MRCGRLLVVGHEAGVVDLLDDLRLVVVELVGVLRLQFDGGRVVVVVLGLIVGRVVRVAGGGAVARWLALVDVTVFDLGALVALGFGQRFGGLDVNADKVERREMNSHRANTQRPLSKTLTPCTWPSPIG